MFTANVNQAKVAAHKPYTFMALPVKIDFLPKKELGVLLGNLTPDKPWAERQTAARKIGLLGNPKALPALLNALPKDPFWMVRCAIIQALEMIGDARALPMLQELATTDEFEIVRGYANNAIEKLTQ